MKKIFKVKLIVFSVILFVLKSVVDCDKLENDKSDEITEDNQNDTETASVKIKRGIYNYGYGSALSYSIPPTVNYGYHKSYLSSPYSRFPGVYKNLATHGAVAITPGSASVHSYNVNYPRYNVLASRPVVGRPAFVPSIAPIAPVAPLAPTPALFAPQRPIIPVSYPTYSHRFPVVVQRPYTPFVVQRPAPVAPAFPAGIPASPFLPAPASFPAGFIPAAPFPASIPAASFPVAPAPVAPFPPIHSVFNGYNPLQIHPQLIPIPSAQPTIPTSGNTPQAVPQPGFLPTDGWRPIIVNQPAPGILTTPTTTTTAIRPSIDLLPPHLQPAATNGQGEVQTTPQIPDNTYLPQKPPNNYYLTPTDGTALDQGTTQQQYTSEDFAQAQGKS